MESHEERIESVYLLLGYGDWEWVNLMRRELKEDVELRGDRDGLVVPNLMRRELKVIN